MARPHLRQDTYNHFVVAPCKVRTSYQARGKFCYMTYAINIDQVFAQEHGLTLTQAASLSAFMTLPIWSKAIVKDGEIWYTYSDEKMSQDFPLLFGVPKRCYKNLSELEALGFVVTGKEKKVKIVRFTSLCDTWNKEKSENGLNSSKKSEIGPKKSENGLKKSENGPNLEREEKYTKEEKDNSYINYNNYNNYNDKKSKLSVEEKIEAFRATCAKFVEKYGEDVVRGFFNHYAQVCPNGELLCERKRRVDGAFEVSRRMATWAQNEAKWHGNKPAQNTPQRPVAQPQTPKRTPWEQMGITEEQYRTIYK